MSDVPGLGHNKPPPPDASLHLTPEQWAERLCAIFEQPSQRASELLASFQRFAAGYPLKRAIGRGEPPVGIDKWSDDIQGKAGDLRDKLVALLKVADAIHTMEKAPVLTAGRSIDGFLRAFREPIDAAIATIRERQTIYGIWQENESRRLAKEEAERRIQEARAAAEEAARTLAPDALQHASETASEADIAARHADAKPAEHSRTHGETSVTSLRSTWRFVPDESDLMTLVQAIAAGKEALTYVTFNETRIRLAIRVEHVHKIAGCAIHEDKVAR